MDTMCKNHKPHNLGMLAWYHWIEEKERRGAKQKQCPVCKRWFFKEELK